MTTMNKIKMAAAAILAILLVVVILQNTKPVETKLVFITITMPRAVLLVTMLGLGFALGILAAGRLTRKKATP